MTVLPVREVRRRVFRVQRRDIMGSARGYRNQTSRMVSVTVAKPKPDAGPETDEFLNDR